MRADLSALGKKIGLAYILVIDISSSTDADEEVSTVISSESTMDDFYWPAFSILQMQTKGKANLETKLFSVASGDFLQTYSDSPAVIDTYDTTATYTASRAMISSENTTRRIENGNREKIASQRIKEQAESDKSVIGQIAVALSDASEYNLPMITPPPFAQKKYKDRISLFKAVYAAGFNSIFTSYFARYDGKTVYGDTVNGTGTFSFASKAICSGQWASAQSSGQCEYTLSSGAKYAGTFIGGKADGTGVFTDANGNRYEGEFKSGLRNGKGTLYIETPPNDVYIDGFGRVLIGQGVVYDNRDTLTNVMKLKKKCSYTVTAADGRYMTIKAQKNAPASSGKPSSPVK